MSWNLLGRDFLSTLGSGKHFNHLYCNHSISEKKAVFKEEDVICPSTNHTPLNLSLKYHLIFIKWFLFT